MTMDTTPARSELIVGGQKSGKSRRAQALARAWLAQSSGHRAVLVATARGDDEEMRERIKRHQRDRLHDVPAVVTMEEPLELARALHTHNRSDTLVVVDCVTLWLTNLLWPAHGAEEPVAGAPVALPDVAAATAALLQAVAGAAGPVVLVSNEIGLGVVPMGREVRAFVDALGLLNQQLAGACERVTLMASGLPLVLKGAA